jgi:hypothetical protein
MFTFALIASELVISAVFCELKSSGYFSGGWGRHGCVTNCSLSWCLCCDSLVPLFGLHVQYFTFSGSMSRGSALTLLSLQYVVFTEAENIAMVGICPPGYMSWCFTKSGLALHPSWFVACPLWG